MTRKYVCDVIYPYDVILSVCSAVQYVRATVHQLYERTTPAVLQPPHVRAGAGRVQEGRHPVGVHRLWNGPRADDQPHRKGTIARTLICRLVAVINEFHKKNSVLVHNS